MLRFGCVTWRSRAWAPQWLQAPSVLKILNKISLQRIPSKRKQLQKM